MKHTKAPNQNESVAAIAASAGGDVAVGGQDAALDAPGADVSARTDAGEAPSEPDVREAFSNAPADGAPETDGVPFDESDLDETPVHEDGQSHGEADGTPIRLFDGEDGDDVDLHGVADPSLPPRNWTDDEDDGGEAEDDEADDEEEADDDGDEDEARRPVKRPVMRRTPDAPRRKKAKAAAPAARKKPVKPRDEGETNLKIIRAFLIAGVLLAVALVVVVVLMNREGKQADAYANQLLEAYESRTAAPAAEATPAPTNEPTESPAPTAEPSPIAALDEYGEPIAVTESPEPVEETSTEADAEAMAAADEHALDDGSHEGVDESADYVQPEAPEASAADQIINEVRDKVGDDGVIGIITIPEIDVKLPIIGKWSYNLLKISVCRYKGPAVNEKGNLVVIGHNYKSGAHFGNLDELTEGSAVYLTDSNSNKVRYEVYDMVTISPDAFSSLNTYKGTRGLTLMTCKNQGQNRLLVRCVQKDAEIPQPR